jgi:hypothetical protein
MSAHRSLGSHVPKLIFFIDAAAFVLIGAALAYYVSSGGLKRTLPIHMPATKPYTLISSTSAKASFASVNDVLARLQNVATAPLSDTEKRALLTMFGTSSSLTKNLSPVDRQKIVEAMNAR